MRDGTIVVEAQDVRAGMTLLGKVYTETNGDQTTKPMKPRQVKEVEPCRGAWRSHVHIDGGCWPNVFLLRVRS